MNVLKARPGPGLIVMAWVLIILSNSRIEPLNAGFDAPGKLTAISAASVKAKPRTPCF